MEAPEGTGEHALGWPDPITQPLLRPSDLTRRGLLPGMGRSAIYEALRRGDLPSIRVGSRVFIPTAQLLTHLGLAADAPAAGGIDTGAA